MSSTTQSIYPPGPQAVPENFTKATARYKRHAWIALGALFLFVGLYLGLTAWFCWQAWHMFILAKHAGENILQILLDGTLSAALAVFMIKGLFFVKQSGQSRDIELTQADEPALFEFLYKLADEARAPRPHRVFLSAAVNAAVYYDLSIINLLFPTRKNLEIGLGLVNVLSLAEFKAVLAHEYGHFAQRTMAVGRWVYIAQQIATHLVSQRDGFDKFVSGLSRIDIRVAWIGWILSLLVWSIRSVIELSSRVVVIAQRALSREMEMQADLVAVSLTGSDALMHALYKTGPAEEAWTRTITFVKSEYSKNRRLRDFFTVQSRVIDHLRVVYDDLQFGRVPPAEGPAASRRLFKVDFARPPAMWSTHPLNHEREENAKKVYVEAPLDERSAWTVFRDAKALRQQVSEALFKEIDSNIPVISDAEAQENLDAEYRREYLNRFYRGCYLARSVVRSKGTIDELYDKFTQIGPDPLGRIYPASLSAELETLREMQRENAMLKAIDKGLMQTSGSNTYFRGRLLRRKDIPRAIMQAEAELTEVENRILAHDRLCRTAHLLAARQQGGQWEAYLKSLLSLMHYADHCGADLRDLQGMTSNVYHVITAGGKVNEDKINRLLAACQQLYHRLSAVYVESEKVQPGTAVLERMEIAQWKEWLGEFRLAAPDRNNLNDWLKVIDDWINVCVSALTQLYEAALGELLKTEAALAKAHHTGVQLGAAPEPAIHPDDYPRLLPGGERKRQTSLDLWSRFHSADGTIATVAKFAVAGSLVLSVLAFGFYSGRGDLTIYNGLDNTVQVTVAGNSLQLAPRARADIKVPVDTNIELVSTIGKVEIERFTEHIDNKSAHYLYNIAGAAAFVQYTVLYGTSGEPPPPDYWGNPRWREVDVDHLMSEPPRSISDRYRNTRTVLASLSDRTPVEQLSKLGKDQEKVIQEAQSMSYAHARFDAANSSNLLMWMGLLRDAGTVDDLVKLRLQIDPYDVIALRTEQDRAIGTAHAEVCRRQTALADKVSTNIDNEANLQYLKIRCMEKGELQTHAFLAAAQRWQRNPWLQMAAGYIDLDRLDLDSAAHHFNVTVTALPATVDWVYVDLARGRRMQDPHARLDDLINVSSELRSIMALESGVRDNDTDPVWDALLKGDLKRAHAALKPTQILSRQEILLAASDGAQPAWAEHVLAATPDAGWSNENLFYAMAMAMRAQKDIGPYVQILKTRPYLEIERLLVFLQDVQQGRMPTDKLDNVDLSVRGDTYAMALILKGKSAPAAWRDGAKRLLFQIERPYFD